MADDFRHRFSTKAFEAAGDSALPALYYYGYRYYAPRHGRWLSRDPLGEEGGLLLYGFCGNGPLGAVDALGEAPFGSIRGLLGNQIVGRVLQRELRGFRDAVRDLGAQTVRAVHFFRGIARKRAYTSLAGFVEERNREAGRPMVPKEEATESTYLGGVGNVTRKTLKAPFWHMVTRQGLYTTNAALGGPSGRDLLSFSEEPEYGDFDELATERPDVTQLPQSPRGRGAQKYGARWPENAKPVLRTPQSPTEFTTVAGAITFSGTQLADLLTDDGRFEEIRFEYYHCEHAYLLKLSQWGEFSSLATAQDVLQKWYRAIGLVPPPL
jgi:RHS repeat-associated protein